jgi:S1-C subfamily serine protease
MQRNTKFKVTFGIVPSYGSTKKGLEVDGISKADGPAAKAGILKGDVIKTIDGKPINDIYEFMDRLGELEPGMTIKVLIDRNGAERELPVTF